MYECSMRKITDFLSILIRYKTLRSSTVISISKDICITFTGYSVFVDYCAIRRECREIIALDITDFPDSNIHQYI